MELNLGIRCNPITNDRRMRFLEFASSNYLILAHTFGTQNHSQKWTLHSRNIEHHSQIGYIMVRKRFPSSVNFAQTRTFRLPILEVMMTFRLRLKRAQQQTSKRMKYNLDGLKSPNLMQQFKAILGGKFHQLIDITDTHVDVDKLTKTFNTPIIDIAT